MYRLLSKPLFWETGWLVWSRSHWCPAGDTLSGQLGLKHVGHMWRWMMDELEEFKQMEWERWNAQRTIRWCCCVNVCTSVVRHGGLVRVTLLLETHVPQLQHGGHQLQQTWTTDRRSHCQLQRNLTWWLSCDRKTHEENISWHSVTRVVGNIQYSWEYKKRYQFSPLLGCPWSERRPSSHWTGPCLAGQESSRFHWTWSDTCCNLPDTTRLDSEEEEEEEGVTYRE